MVEGKIEAVAICIDSRLWYDKFPIMATSGITCYWL